MSRTAEILKRLEAGDSQANIARALGITESAISHLRLRKGLRAKVAPRSKADLQSKVAVLPARRGRPRRASWPSLKIEDRRRLLMRLGFDPSEAEAILRREATPRI